MGGWNQPSMIYVCIPSHNHSATVGLVLWKVRQGFAGFPREYQLLVGDDASTDATAELLEPYTRALPMTLIRHEKRRGHAATLDTLLREALAQSDRPKRDCTITLPADFSISPDSLPALVKGIESGADLVVAERRNGQSSRLWRWVLWSAPWLLRPGVTLPGVRDLLSGACAVRLSTLKDSLRERPGTLLESEGSCAYAELLARTAVEARQIAVVPASAMQGWPDTTAAAASRGPGPLGFAIELFRAGRRLRIPAPTAEIRRME